MIDNNIVLGLTNVRIIFNLNFEFEFRRLLRWGGLERLGVYQYFDLGTRFQKVDGWQRAPVRIVFDVKQQDHKFKARPLVGGHVIDSSDTNTYSSTIKDISVRLMMLVA